jgi:CRP-like cAMP-binding protein
LTPAQLEQVAEAAVERGFDAEEHLLKHDEDVQGLFIVVSGELQAYVGEEQVDFERELTRLYPGDYFGMVAMLTRDRSQAAVRALSMIPKSGNRFSEKIMLNQKARARL